MIEENKIGMDPKLDTFTVMGSEHTHVVTLFPKELVSALSQQNGTTLAAKMKFGQKDQKL